jgi:hypothetical protein
MLAGTVSARDTIKLKNGELVYGWIWDETGDDIKLRGGRTVNKADVQWIRRDRFHHGSSAERHTYDMTDATGTAAPVTPQSFPSPTPTPF